MYVCIYSIFMELILAWRERGLSVFLFIILSFYFLVWMESKMHTYTFREHSPKERGLRRQSTTEEILLSRGFRRQSTTEDIMRARNYRRQSTQSEEMSRSRGRRDSSAQITDGTIATMTVETQCAFFDTSTQTGQSVPVLWMVVLCLSHLLYFVIE